MYLLTMTTWSFSGRTSKEVKGIGESEALLHWIQYNWPVLDIDAHNFLAELNENGTVDTDTFCAAGHEYYFTVEKVDVIN